MTTKPLLALSLSVALAALACHSSGPAAEPDPVTPSTPASTDLPAVSSAKATPANTAPVPTSSAPAEPAIVAPKSSAAPRSDAAPAAPAPAEHVLKLTQGKIDTADADLAAADDKVRACLSRSKGAGEVAVKITVATSGFALSATATPSGDVSKDSVKCAQDALRNHTFGKPVGGGVAAATGTFKVAGT